MYNIRRISIHAYSQAQLHSSQPAAHHPSKAAHHPSKTFPIWHRESPVYWYMFTQGVHIVCIEYMDACKYTYSLCIMYVLNTYGVYIFEYIPSHPFNIFWMPQLPTNVDLVGCFFLKPPRWTGLGRWQRSLKTRHGENGESGRNGGTPGQRLEPFIRLMDKILHQLIW